MGGPPAPARRLHLDVAERARLAGRRHERRQPEVRELRPDCPRLLAFDLARGRLLEPRVGE
jgi:hypothetical protein